MKAMILEKQGKPLSFQEVDLPEIQSGEILVKVHMCGVCRTDLHIVDGDLKEPKLPLIPGHQIVGTIQKMASDVTGLSIGQRVGIPWLGKTCGSCLYCRNHQENLCDGACFTGYQINGGFAEYACASAMYCFPLPNEISDLQAAPLLCAGLIGYRSYKMADAGEKIGFYGFGQAAHLLVQLAVFEKKKVYAFTKKGDRKKQEFAKSLGAVWAGASDENAPELLDSAIIFAPLGALVPTALKAIRKGGRVILAGIHMSDIPKFPYSILWGERSIHSVANLTRKDAREYLVIASQIPIHSETIVHPLQEANQALKELKEGVGLGAHVLKIS